MRSILAIGSMEFRTGRSITFLAILLVYCFKAFSSQNVMTTNAGELASRGADMCWTLCLGLVIYLTSTSIAREKNRDTYSFFLTNPNPRWHLLAGKFLGVFYLVMLFLIITFPARTPGQFCDMSWIGRCLVFYLSNWINLLHSSLTLLLIAALAFFCSTIAGTPTKSFISTCLLLFFIEFIPRSLGIVEGYNLRIAAVILVMFAGSFAIIRKGDVLALWALTKRSAPFIILALLIPLALLKGLVEYRKATFVVTTSDHINKTTLGLLNGNMICNRVHFNPLLESRECSLSGGMSFMDENSAWQPFGKRNQKLISISPCGTRAIVMDPNGFFGVQGSGILSFFLGFPFHTDSSGRYYLTDGSKIISELNSGDISFGNSACQWQWDNSGGIIAIKSDKDEKPRGLFSSRSMKYGGFNINAKKDSRLIRIKDGQISKIGHIKGAKWNFAVAYHFYHLPDDTVLLCTHYHSNSYNGIPMSDSSDGKKQTPRDTWARFGKGLPETGEPFNVLKDHTFRCHFTAESSENYIPVERNGIDYLYSILDMKLITITAEKKFDRKLKPKNSDNGRPGDFPNRNLVLNKNRVSAFWIEDFNSYLEKQGPQLTPDNLLGITSEIPSEIPSEKASRHKETNEKVAEFTNRNNDPIYKTSKNFKFVHWIIEENGEIKSGTLPFDSRIYSEEVKLSFKWTKNGRKILIFVNKGTYTDTPENLLLITQYQLERLEIPSYMAPILKQKITSQLTCLRKILIFDPLSGLPPQEIYSDEEFDSERNLDTLMLEKSFRYRRNDFSSSDNWPEGLVWLSDDTFTFPRAEKLVKIEMNGGRISRN
ncbi:MAG: hypothetical protein CVV64_18515 [Candidatus Wallbacteria bacterium HGW-Wallbacteria-1]|uniref:Uncharacterized protein n=1 Tax=Candidatus Wallbacteria bacterium HGW-Wallbacteria-1 TaxID=2013854 RepID=A0A2N1PJH1_9BACT|nr:MAG: hypothetical protein CVV64_18515 [Candidatus Wallbacteria bacterium HGW-Wallbacteria-1]